MKFSLTNLRKCYKINLSGILVREASSDMRLYKYAKYIKLVKERGTHDVLPRRPGPGAG